MSKAYGRLPETSEVFIYVAMSRLMVRSVARRSTRPGPCRVCVPQITLRDSVRHRTSYGARY
jgi:hypothetical protein